jgi:cell division protein FtsL
MLTTILLIVMIVVLAGGIIWNEIKVNELSKRVESLKWSKGQAISRNEFDCLKNSVQKLKRK